MRKGTKGMGGGNKYKSQNFKALMMINLSYFQIKADGNHYISRPYRPTIQLKQAKKNNAVSNDHIVTM